MPTTPATQKVPVEVEGRRLALSNLDKVLYPEAGFTKGEVIDYYTRIAPVLLPHVEERALTRKRWPDGVQAQPFFEKNVPRGTPDWVRTVRLPVPGSTKDRETIDYVVADDLPTVVWLANLAVLEFHVPQWRVDRRGRAQPPDRLVLDLDPGPPANVVDCAKVAVLLRELLVGDGLEPFAKSSGSKGMQLLAAIEPKRSGDDVSAYAKQLAQRLERDHPRLVVSNMEKRLRHGKVLVDWSQNNPAKTTVAPYSLRGREHPTVSTPVTWEEVERAARSTARNRLPLRFTAAQALDRVDEHGDLMAGLADGAAPLP
jgi:bifunctional non-homologous end joining protein LigD